MSILLNNNQNNTWRASNTWRAKVARQYVESQKCQTIPREPKVSDNTWRTRDL